MSNRHQELASLEANDFCKKLASPKQTPLGKDISNPLILKIQDLFSKGSNIESSPEFGGASESSGCGDDEPGGNEDGDEDEEDGDRVLTRTGLVNPIRPNGQRVVYTVSTVRPTSTARPGNPEICLQDHAVVDSGCSSHMTGNKAYLLDYEDYNGGFVAFGSDPKRGKFGAARQIWCCQAKVCAGCYRYYCWVLALESIKDAQAAEIRAMDEGSKVVKLRSKLADDTEVVKDKSSGDKGGNDEELVRTARPEVSTARPDIDAARQEDSVVKPRTPPKQQKELAEEGNERNGLRQDQASMDYIESLYDEVQAKMDASEELAARLQMEERERYIYTIEERKDVKRYSEKDQGTTKEASLKIVPDEEEEIDYEVLGTRFIQKQIDEFGGQDGSEKDL
ncbi:hypothetical protein Tco_0269298 [Tanacetum coccineum]